MSTTFREKQKEKAEKKISQLKETASEDDIKKINSKIDAKNKGPLEEVRGKVLLMNLIKDPNTAWTAKATAIGVLFYVVSRLMPFQTYS